MKKRTQTNIPGMKRIQTVECTCQGCVYYIGDPECKNEDAKCLELVRISENILQERNYIFVQDNDAERKNQMDKEAEYQFLKYMAEMRGKCDKCGKKEMIALDDSGHWICFECYMKGITNDKD